jgi:diphosphomevalonate decarboxylase
LSTTWVENATTDSFTLDGQQVEDQRIINWLALLREEFDIPPLSIRSENNFPTAAGLASSASGFAALITAIDHHCKLEISLTRRSSFARMASGSAARSIFGGFVSLTQPDWVARPLLDSACWPLKVVIAITDESQKTVSSSAGMQRSRASSPYYATWISSSQEDYIQAEIGVQQRDFAALGHLAEASCLKMHAVMQSSVPALIYWRAATLACLERIRELQQSGIDVFFTIDAGPQVKAVCTQESEQEVIKALTQVSGVIRAISVGLGAGATAEET